MKDLIAPLPQPDEFALIELGSVSEETRGITGVEEEFDGASNSRPL